MIELSDLTKLRDAVKDGFLPDLEALIATVTNRGGNLTNNERRAVAERAQQFADRLARLPEIERQVQIKADAEARLSELKR